VAKFYFSLISFWNWGTHATGLFQLLRLRLTDIVICWDIDGIHCQQAYALFEKASELKQHHFYILFS
jgi:hypothetical protein